MVKGTICAYKWPKIVNETNRQKSQWATRFLHQDDSKDEFDEDNDDDDVDRDDDVDGDVNDDEKEINDNDNKYAIFKSLYRS